MAGKHNSSLTRVQPAFRELLKRDRSGQDWLPHILNLAAPCSPLLPTILPSLGSLLPGTEGSCFERPVPPPTEFLRWLIKHPEQMTWPTTRKTRKRFREATQERREKLFAGQHDALQEALDCLAECGAMGSRGQWWAFEGFTNVDCCLETQSLMLFIEGKRTESLSSSTEWYAARCQLIRNIESVKDMAGNKQYGVLLITEDAVTLSDLDARFSDSLPHLTHTERAELKKHFLGCLQWRDLCRVTGLEFEKLPDVVTPST